MSASTETAVIVVAVVVLLLAWRALRFLFMRLLAAAAPLRRFGGWAARHPLRARLKQMLPRLYALLAARLEPRRFQGLPLTLLAAGALYLMALFGGLIVDLREADEIIRFDAAVDAVFAPWRGGALERLFLWLTTLGDSATLTAVTLVATGLLWSAGRQRTLLPLWITILGSQATTWIGKFALARHRPDFVTTATALSPSFPSAHTTGSMAVYGFLAYVVARDLADPRRRFDVGYWTMALIAVIGVSRVFLSVHFASDVAGGLLVGGFWLLVGFTVAEWRRWGPAAQSE